ncbi:MAG: Eco57I restriction-modification methylase domain-containing protein [Brevinema sp.]
MMQLLKQEIKKLTALIVDKFSIELNEYNDIITVKSQENPSEENLKNDLQTFFVKAFNYQTELDHDKIDLTLWENGQLKTIIETKSVASNDMIIELDFNRKSFHQSLFYYMEQQSKSQNAIESIIITDYKTMFVIREIVFKELSQRTPIKNAFKKYAKDKETCYKEFKEIFARENYQIKYYTVDLNDPNQAYSLLCPEFLYNKPMSNDSNSLNRYFYDELLYIMGLQEEKYLLVKSNVKNSLFDITEQMMGKKDSFELVLGLNILWLDRILFLKILESQLKTFRDDKDFAILSPDKITGYHLLSKLFFNILSTHKNSRHEDDINTYRLIPYLNSSLFEETELERVYGIKNLDIERKILIKKDSILFKDKNFKQKELTVLEYLLRFLNCYQFNTEGECSDPHTTIKSSVLGLVFEKLNGYKDGSHFTPASITMYMSKEVIQRKVLDKFNDDFEIRCDTFEELIEFVRSISYKADQKEKANKIIDSITILDPAVGSGHFLVSCLNELIRVKSELGLLHKDIKIDIQDDELIIKSSFGDEFVYQMKNNKITPEKQAIQQAIFETKKHIIEHQLYGIDINPNSVNICRLRLWIELLKHSYYTDEQYLDLEVLPNLEFKVMTANSLIALKKEQSTLIPTEYESLTESLHQQFNDYYTAQGDKNAIKMQISETLDKMKEMTVFSTDGNDQIEQLKVFSPFDTTVVAPFFDSAFMFGLRHVDIVLMNPPYFALQSLKKENNPYQGKIFETYTATGDIYQLFLEKALDFINDQGIVSAIVSNKWMRAGYGEGTREHLYKNAHVLEVLDLGSSWFESATVDTNIISYEKRRERPHQQSISAYTMNHQVNSIPEGKVEQKQIRANERGDAWIILNEWEAGILDKMNKVGEPLKDWDITINYGIKTGFNNAFIIDGATKDRLIEEDSRSAEILKPLLRGRDIKRYSYEFADQWLINTHNGIKSKNIDPIDIKDYPAIKKHLDQYGNQIKKRQDQGNTPYNLRNCAYLEDFDKPKIVYPNMTKFLPFVLDDKGYYTNQKCFIICHTKKNIKQLEFMIGFMNSKLAHFWIRWICPELQGGTRELSSIFFENLPIPIPTKGQERTINALVDTILEKKQHQLPTDKEEQQIDQIVYEMYGLSEEEIRIIEA